MRLSYNGKLKQLSRNLRNDMTREEGILWSKIRNNQLGVKFSRQKTIGNYIVDFYCHKAKLVVEIDGTQHYLEKGRKNDKVRDTYFKKEGLKVLRFSNIQVLRDLDLVIRTIWIELGNEF